MRVFVCPKCGQVLKESHVQITEAYCKNENKHTETVKMEERKV